MSSDCRFAHFGVTLVGTVVGLAWELLCRVVPIVLVLRGGFGGRRGRVVADRPRGAGGGLEMIRFGGVPPIARNSKSRCQDLI